MGGIQIERARRNDITDEVIKVQVRSLPTSTLFIACTACSPF
jgi:hypothetical protein